MSEKVIAQAGEIIKSKTAAENMGAAVALSLIDSEGYPTTSAVSISKSDGVRQITFCTTMDSNKAKRAGACDRASVCIFDDDYSGNSYYNITLAGTIEIVSDPEIKKEMWYEGMAEHCSGPDDANFCVLRFTTKRYNLWVCGMEEEATGRF
jgi:general stress protein 26